MTVGELLRRISSRELSEWMAYFSLEPWGCEVEDWRFGMLASVIANVNRDPKKRSRQYEPRDFMPNREEQMQELDEEYWEQQAQVMEAWIRGLHARARGGPS